MFWKYFLHFLVLQFVVIHYQTSNANPLLGEKVKRAKKNEFPFMVSLTRLKETISKERHMCGGALISKKHVLTAAHCIENENPEKIVVVAGNIEIVLGRVYKIESWITYDDWARENNVISEYTGNDIGIVTLVENVKGIKPAVISKLTPEEVIDRKVVTAGWGFINETTQLRPDSLMKARLRVLSLPDFESIMDKYPERGELLPNNYATVAYPNAILGCGDSGGPLFLENNNEIVGVNESSCDVDDPEEYDVEIVSYHVIVDYYRDFINDVTKK